MAILARGGSAYARLRFNIGPGAEMLIPVEVDYSKTFAASNPSAWLEEYRANIRADDWHIVKTPTQTETTTEEGWLADTMEDHDDSDLP